MKSSKLSYCSWLSLEILILATWVRIPVIAIRIILQKSNFLKIYNVIATTYSINSASHAVKTTSDLAQRKRIGPITLGSLDRNQESLIFWWELSVHFRKLIATI